jgi:hypothetical protein
MRNPVPQWWPCGHFRWGCARRGTRKRRESGRPA